MSTSSREPRPSAPAVMKAMRILSLLAETPSRPRPLSEIARDLELAKSSTSSLCVSLVHGGLIRQVDGGYLLGRGVVDLASSYLAGFDQIREFYRICEESPVLNRQLVQIAMLHGTRVLYLAVYEGRERFPLSASVGDRYPASATAVGTALLSELPPARIAELYPQPTDLVTFTDRTTADLAGLQAKLHATRERGYALDDGEVHPSVYALAMLIRATQAGDPSFALGVSIVHPADTPEERRSVLAAVRRATQELSPPVLVPDTSTASSLKESA